ncbi:MAG: MFS transporter [Gammaproteobacteria bacterium]|nr:MAG: MFS transporter [Gammaproteobacteria bacterium]
MAEPNVAPPPAPTSTTNENGQLKLSVIWSYTLSRVAFSIMGVMFGVYLMKYATDVLLIAPATMGILIAAARLWDGVTDPLVGYLSDRTRSRIGRRRIWLYASALPMAIGLVMIWSPPGDLSGLWLVAWMAVSLLVYETASTTYLIPHAALGMELTPNYHERTRLFGYAHMIGFLGTIIGMGTLQLMTMAEDKRAFALDLSLVAATIVFLTVVITTRFLPERSDYQGRGNQSIIRSVLDVFKNPHARLLLIVFAIETYGMASIMTLTPYLVSYVFPLEAYLVAVMMTYTLAQVIFTPFWMWLARRIGKQRAWTGALLLSAVPFISFFFLSEPGWIFWVLTFLCGFLAGCGAVVQPAIQADVIDYDELTTGDRKEGAYLAVWNLIRKSSASLCALVTGLVLQYSGFEPNQVQSETTVDAIRATFGLLPATCYLIGGLLFARFSFNEAEHAAARATIESRA